MTHAQSAAASARDTLVAQIQAGVHKPGDRLDEVSLTSDLRISRNTLREAFRLLAHGGYAVHKPNRGVFVRQIPAAQAHHVYEARRFLECGTLRELAVDSSALNADALDVARRAVDIAEQAAAVGDWQQVAAANTAFHEALAAVAGNDTVASMVADLMVDMRLLFLGSGSAASVHGRYVAQNRQVVELMTVGEFARAAVALDLYLLEAERHLVDVD